MTKRIITMGLSTSLLMFSLSASTLHAADDEDLDSLVKWLSGSFSSQRQSTVDTAYFHVDLHMNRIWNDRTDGIWMIVEQAMATSPQAPYRQRVYNIKRVEENMIELIVYAWKDSKRVIGAWKDVSLVADLSPSDLSLRRGCEVYLQRDEFKFLGGTHGTACSSDIRGASYATSEVQIADKIIASWDRGYTAKGDQVWGAVKGPYYFLRQKP
ncbi:MAG: chromophore lyase CpcT/CpeT [Candidatus Kapaibacterium sp.]